MRRLCCRTSLISKSLMITARWSMLLLVSCTTEREALRYRDQGMTKLSEQRYREAVVDFNSAIDLNPDAAVPYAGRGYAKLILGDYREARVDFDEATRADSEYAEAYIGRAQARMVLGEYPEALSDFDVAIRLAQKSGEAYFGRGAHADRSRGLPGSPLRF